MSSGKITQLPRGIYTPLPTFFNENEDLDLEALKSHVRFTASAGTIPVLSGTAGEAVHLSHGERRQLIVVTRKALDDAGLKDVPIVAGVGAPSTRETIELAKEAADAGADFVMAIPPGYYAGALKAEGGRGLREFFVDVADASPVPVVVYNFPSVSGGIDLDSDLILEIVKASSNVCGTKLTCANVGKISRLTAVAHSPEFMTEYPRNDPAQRFEVIDGYIDILLPSVAVGSAGAISGLPNFVPNVCVELWKLSQALPGGEEYKKAQRLHGLIALADGVAAIVGIAGMKQILHQKFGYCEKTRRPLLPMSQSAAEQLLNNEYIQKLLVEEQRLVAAQA